MKQRAGTARGRRREGKEQWYQFLLGEKKDRISREENTKQLKKIVKTEQMMNAKVMCNRHTLNLT